MTKKIFFTSLLLIISHFYSFSLDTWIRVNQLGYLPEGIKKAVVLSETPLKINSFTINDALTDKEVGKSENIKSFGPFGSFKYVYVLNFTTFSFQGAYYLKAGIFYSPVFYISNAVYDNTSDLILNYFRQQRCGENIALNLECHQNDGNVAIKKVLQPIEVKVPSLSKNSQVKTTTTNLKSGKTRPDSVKQLEYKPQTILTRIDAIGGWHTDLGFSKNGAIAANAVLNMLRAYQENPKAFADRYDAVGRKVKNGIPDILDEARWGLNWLIKLNPQEDVLYHQVGDDRDLSVGYRPDKDSLNYGYGIGVGRQVFKATGAPQGLFKYQNKSNGIASLAGKYASAFALASDIYGEIDQTFSDSLQILAERLYKTGKKYPGVTQSVPGKRNKYIEESNWNDDMELAAAQLYRLTFSSGYMNDAVNYGRMEPVSPWIFADSVNYYQWFPLTNIGHLTLATVENPAVKSEFVNDIKTNLSKLKQEMTKNPFLIPVPMFQNSNDYIVSLATQCTLYRKFTADTTFIELETALTDWLFGCNPWGVSMMVGCSDNAVFPHHLSNYQSQHLNILPVGGLINGPVRQSDFDKEFAGSLKPILPDFNSGEFYYTDRSEDYLTNAISFDGTASLLYLLALKQSEADHASNSATYQMDKGAIIRTDTAKKTINLVFAANEYVDGLKFIQKALIKNQIKASFFVTGDFLRKKANSKFVRELFKTGNYIGPYTDKYLIACDNSQSGRLLVSQKEFVDDLKNNYSELEKTGIPRQEALLFYPAAGVYNDSVSRWCRDVGVKIVCRTPGLRSSSDISIPEMREGYFSSLEIYNQILTYEANHTLNGNILMFHTGSDKKRSDKFYKRLSSLIFELKSKGYEFTTLKQTTN